MSKTYEIFSIENDELILKEEGLNFLKSIKEQIILISFFSSLSDKKATNSIKISVLSELTNNNNIQKNNNIITLYESSIKKENSHEKVLLLDADTNNQYLLSLLFLASSLFVFFVDGNLNEEELSKFILINSLQDTIKFNNKKDKEIIFKECAPELVFFISNYNSNLPKYYLDTELNKRENNKKVNFLKENLINIFPEKSCILEEDNQKNNLLEKKIIEEIKPKHIKEKLFDGNSLAFFFQKFLEMHKNKGKPNFDELLSNLIDNDLETYKNEALSYFNSEMVKLEQVENEENLIPKIYKIRINSMEKFNNINFLIQNIFHKPEFKDYKTLYNNYKSELETKFTEQENLKILKNFQNGDKNCNELLNKHYSVIDEKISKGAYNPHNIDEYLKDYKLFLNNYKKEAKGNNKLKCLINFLEINKPKFFKYLLEGGGDKNLELKKGELNAKKEEKRKQIEEIHQKVERKRREIKYLKAEMDRIEEEISKIQTIDEGPSYSSKNQFKDKHLK